MHANCNQLVDFFSAGYSKLRNIACLFENKNKTKEKTYFLFDSRAQSTKNKFKKL